MALLLPLSFYGSKAFAPSFSIVGVRPSQRTTDHPLLMSQDGKKKRRRRKQFIDDPEISSQDSMPTSKPYGSDVPSIDELKLIANFTPSKSKSSSNTSFDQASASFKTFTNEDGLIESSGADSSLVDLPDIRDALKNKELKKLEQEKQEVNSRPKISRKDRKALLQVSVSSVNMFFSEKSSY
jgi:hypothetical protein